MNIDEKIESALRIAKEQIEFLQDEISKESTIGRTTTPNTIKLIDEVLESLQGECCCIDTNEQLGDLTKPQEEKECEYCHQIGFHKMSCPTTKMVVHLEQPKGDVHPEEEAAYHAENNPQEEKTPREKDIELRDMYDLVDSSLLKETDSDQPHYVEVGKAQEFCERYAKSLQPSQISDEEIEKVISKRLPYLNENPVDEKNVIQAVKDIVQQLKEKT